MQYLHDATGAHFHFHDMCKRLQKVKETRDMYIAKIEQFTKAKDKDKVEDSND